MNWYLLRCISSFCKIFRNPMHLFDWYSQYRSDFCCFETFSFVIFHLAINMHLQMVFNNLVQDVVFSMSACGATQNNLINIERIWFNDQFVDILWRKEQRESDRSIFHIFRRWEWHKKKKLPKVVWCEDLQ